MVFGQRLKYFRTINHVTQQELADYLKVSRSTIAGYETKGKEPDYNTLIQIADFFQISVDLLLRDSNYFSNKTTSYDYLIDHHVILEKISKLDSHDIKRLNDYIILLESQPQYNDNRKSHI